MPKRILKVFLASPNDVAAERKIFEEVVEELNGDFGDGANVEFEALMWDKLPGGYDPRPQALINTLVDECDLFIMLLHERWGSPDPNSKYSSYTEEEFQRALNRFRETNVPHIVLLFKDMKVSTRNSPDEQAGRVLRFKAETRSAFLQRPCADEIIVRAEFDMHLRKLAKGELPTPAEEKPFVVPLKISEEFERYKREAQEGKRASELSDLELAKQLIKSAETPGKIGQAIKGLQDLLQRSRFLSVFHIAALFFFEMRDLSNTEQLATYILDGTGGNEVAEDIANHLLSLVWMARGDLPKAEGFCRRSLDLSENANHLGSMLDDYGNLAEILQEKGDYESAEIVIEKLLKLVGHDSPSYSGAKRALGQIRMHQERFEEAWELLQESLKAATAQADHNEICIGLTAWGMLHCMRDNPDASLRNYLEAYDLANKLGDPEKIGVAANGAGLAYIDRKDSERAKEYLEEALAAFSACGDTAHMMAINTSIGSLKLDQKEFAGAEAFLRKALDQARQINNARAQIEINRNLSKVFAGRKAFDDALEILQQCLAWSESGNNRLLSSMVLSDMGHVWKKKGITFKARECFRRALQICKEENSTQGIEATTQFLREL